MTTRTTIPSRRTNKYPSLLGSHFNNFVETMLYRNQDGHHTQECAYEKHDIPSEFDVDFHNSKYLCYSKF